MKIKIQLLNVPQLEIVKHFFIIAINKNIDLIDFIDYYNSLNILKKFADTIFKRKLTPSVKKINLSIDVNEFNTFVKVCSFENSICEPLAIVYFTDIVQSGQRQLQQLQHQHQIKIMQKNEIL